MRRWAAILALPAAFLSALHSAEAVPREIEELFRKSVQAKDLAEKRALRGRIAERSPESAYGLFSRGFLAATGTPPDRKLAVELLGRAIEKKPDFVEAYVNRGNEYFLDRGYDRAKADLDRAVALVPGVAFNYALRGLICAGKQEYGPGILDMNQAIRLSPDDARMIFNRAIIRMNMGDYARARTDLDRALELEPGNIVFFGLRGMARARLGDRDGAIADLTENLNRGGAPRFRMIRGVQYFKTGRYPAAAWDMTVYAWYSHRWVFEDVILPLACLAVLLIGLAVMRRRTAV
jgi:tetratricopeptide (TPR) repeat protein